MLIEILILLVLLGAALYRWITKSFDKWAKIGLAHDKPSFPYGTHNILDGTTHLTDYGLADYKKFKMEKNLPVHGWFLFGKPTLSINDVNLLKHIQVKDFNHFVDRNEVNLGRQFQKGGKLDKIWGFALDSNMGDSWKNVRSAFSPIFTSGKIKIMLKFIKQTSGLLTDDIARIAKSGEEMDLKGSFGKFSLDALASCAFGVDGESFTNDKSVFVKMAADIFVNGTVENLYFLFKLVPGFSKFCEIFNINLFKKTSTKFFVDMVKKTLAARKQSAERRNDLIDLMLDCLKEENIPVEKDKEDNNQFDNDSKLSHDAKGARITEDEVVATAMVFLVAGYDTTGMTLSFLAYAMAKNPEIQEKLQEEIDQAFEDNNGELPDYNTIQNLPYVDMVLHETLRLYYPVGLNTRSCTEDYALPGTDIIIKKDDLISWSSAGLQHDPEHFSHPEEFWPEHFSKEEKAARSPYAFQAFGQGPRSCIGMRFALLEAKVAILNTWHRFSFQPGTKTQEPLVLEPEAALSWPKGGLWANVVERNL